MDLLLEGKNRFLLLLIFSGTYQQLNEVADQALHNETLLQDAANSLSCATQLVLLIIK
jgi:hypothetical protein